MEPIPPSAIPPQPSISPAPPPPPPVPPVISPQPPKKKPFFWLIVLVFLLLLASTGVLAYQYYQLKTQTAAPAPNSSLAPSSTSTPFVSPQPSAEADDPTADWKTFINQTLRVTFKYPNTWQILVSQDKYVRIVSDKVNQSGDFIAVESQAVKTLDEAKDYAVHYYAFSTAGLADQDPKIILEKDISFQNLKAFKYIYRLNRPYSPQSNMVTQILVPINGDVVDIKLQSSDQDLTDQILSTFRFIDPPEAPGEGG